MNKSKMMHRSAAAVLAALMMAAAGTTALAAETPSLSLGQDGAVAAGISLLQPDSTYYFPVQYTHPDGRTVVLPASEAEALELEVKEGTALESAAVRTWNGRCYVRVETAGEIRDGDTGHSTGRSRCGRRRSPGPFPPSPPVPAPPPPKPEAPRCAHPDGYTAPGNSRCCPAAAD